MSDCWPEGALRALVDRELPPDDLARLSAHLEMCPQCGSRYRELSARAARVLDLVGALAEPAAAVPVVRLPRKPVAMPRPNAGRWVAVAAALAAGWAALTLLAPKHVEAPPELHVQVPPPMATTTAPVRQPLAAIPTPAAPLPMRMPGRVTPRPLPRAFPAAPPHATLAGFVALDDDPIDAGVVMRVALAEGQMQADVIYSSDGRPRAIRLVSNGTGK